MIKTKEEALALLEKGATIQIKESDKTAKIFLGEKRPTEICMFTVKRLFIEDKLFPGSGVFGLFSDYKLKTEKHVKFW